MKGPPLWVIAIAVGSAVFGAWVAWGLFVYCQFGGVTNAGIAGDMFGGFSALVGALGFAAVVVNLYFQQQQLRIQAEQLQQEQSSRIADTKIQAAQLKLMSEQLCQIVTDREEKMSPRFVFEKTTNNHTGHTEHVVRMGSDSVKVEAVSIDCEPNDTLSYEARFRNPDALEAKTSTPIDFFPIPNEDHQIHFRINFIRMSDGLGRYQRFRLRRNRIDRVRPLPESSTSSTEAEPT